MKRSCSANVALIGQDQSLLMDISKRPGDDLIEVVKVLLLLQGAVLVATTIEATFWGLVFPGGGSSVLLSGITAAALLIARMRVRVDRRGTRRLVYIVEGITLAFLAIDAALAIALTHAFPPAVALLTGFVLPISVIALLRRAARATAAPGSVGIVTNMEAFS
ncbi:MAG: hypothetical protein ABJB39_08465 [Chloroflexota bacterium]